jgi:hypothetical protein
MPVRWSDSSNSVDQRTKWSARNSIQIYLAWMCSTLGQRDEAFRWLDRAIEERSPQVVSIRVMLELDNIRSDPRFETAPHNDPNDLLKIPETYTVTSTFSHCAQVMSCIINT